METWFKTKDQKKLLEFLLKETPDGIVFRFPDSVMPTKGKDGNFYGCVMAEEAPYLPEGLFAVTESEGLQVCGKCSKTFAKIAKMKLGMT